DLRLDHLLPESAELLAPGNREKLCPVLAHRVHRARHEIRAVDSVGIGELQDAAARDLRAGGARPLLAEPALREWRACHYAGARIAQRRVARNLRRSICGTVIY